MKQLSLVELATLFAFSATVLAGCGYVHTNCSGLETSAITSLKAIANAQTAYRTACGNGGYAASLVVLQTPPAGAAGGFIDAALGASDTPQKSGYTFTMTAGAGSVAGPRDCNGTPTVTAFYATAVPLTYNKTGTRSFAMNQSGLVWQTATATAPTEPFGLPAIPIQ